MSEKSTTTLEKIAPTSSGELSKTLTLSARHQENLRAFETQMTEAAQLAAMPFQERLRGYLAGVMAELNLEGNWDYDSDTYTFSKK